MDYVEAFRNLKTNNKYSRKSPHKAVLLLTIIDMYESCVLTDNAIRYDDTLKDTFVKVWNKVLPYEATFHSDAHLPFWFMQSEGFWHIVPNKGKEDILELLRAPHIKPSDSKLKDCVNYVELDEDLYFLMTLQSGRSSLKRALLETYTSLPAATIDKMSKSYDSFEDSSVNAVSDFEDLLKNSKLESKSIECAVNHELEKKFYLLPEDIQYVFNIEYYTFLKNHRSERDLIKEVCPSVFDLYDKINEHHIKQGEIYPSLAFLYEDFLANLKISLMGEDESFSIIDKINDAIQCLHEEESKMPEFHFEEENDVVEESIPYESSEANEVLPDEDLVSDVEDAEDKPWSEFEIEKLTLFYKNGFEADRIAESLKRSISSVNSQLARLGFIKLPLDVTILNTALGGSICNKYGEVEYKDNAPLKIIDDRIYRFNLKTMCLTVKAIVRTDYGWEKGNKMLVAYSDSDLFPLLSSKSLIEDIEDFVEGENRESNKIKVKGVWYDYYGDIIGEKKKTITKPIKKETSVQQKKRWTASDRRELQTFYQSGMTVEQLAYYFNTDKDSILIVLKKLKMYPR